MAFRYRERNASDWEKRQNQQGGSFEGYIEDAFAVYKPRKGSNAIRILPPTWDDADHFGLDIWVHHDIGPDHAAVICLHRQKGAPCPICEARQNAESANDEDLSKQLKPSKRVGVWLVDRNEEDKGPQIWAMPFTLDREIAKQCQDPRTGKIYVCDHPDDGFDIYFDKTGEGLTTKYGAVRLARNPSTVEENDLDYVEKHPLPSVLRWRDYNELQSLFEGSKAAVKSNDDSAPRRSRETRQPRDNEESPEPRRSRSTDAEEPSRYRDQDTPQRRSNGGEAAEPQQPVERRAIRENADLNGDNVPWDRIDPKEETAPAAPKAAGSARAQELRDSFKNRNQRAT